MYPLSTFSVIVQRTEANSFPITDVNASRDVGRQLILLWMFFALNSSDPPNEKFKFQFCLTECEKHFSQLSILDRGLWFLEVAGVGVDRNPAASNQCISSSEPSHFQPWQRAKDSAFSPASSDEFLSLKMGDQFVPNRSITRDESRP